MSVMGRGEILGLMQIEVLARLRHVSSSLQSERNVAENKIQPKSIRPGRRIGLYATKFDAGDSARTLSDYPRETARNQ